MRAALAVCVSLAGGIAPALGETLQLKCAFENRSTMTYTVDTEQKTVIAFETTMNSQSRFVNGAGGPKKDEVGTALYEYVTVDRQIIQFGVNSCPSRVWMVRMKCDEKVVQSTVIDRIQGTVVLQDARAGSMRGQCERDDPKPRF